MTERNAINGWIVIDKPYEVGSTHVVSKLKWSLSPTRIGHAGTLDPLATGVLPIALGQATKLIPYVMDGTKTYEFRVAWGSETATDDVEGSIVTTSDKRATVAEIRAVLPAFVGVIEQVPPAYSALKINGKRAYDLARAGADVVLKPRAVRIDELTLINATADYADFRVVCGKGTYVRSLGRDIGRRLGCLGHITVLRRTQCGPFRVTDAVPLDFFDVKRAADAVSLLPIDNALAHLPRLTADDVLVKRLLHGQRLALRTVAGGLSCPVAEGDVVGLMQAGRLVGLVRVSGSVVHPYRMFG